MKEETKKISPSSDGLIDPEEFVEEMDSLTYKKVKTKKSGLIERKNVKKITEDGKELLHN